MNHREIGTFTIPGKPKSTFLFEELWKRVFEIRIKLITPQALEKTRRIERGGKEWGEAAEPVDYLVLHPFRRMSRSGICGRQGIYALGSDPFQMLQLFPQRFELAVCPIHPELFPCKKLPAAAILQKYPMRQSWREKQGKGKGAMNRI